MKAVIFSRVSTIDQLDGYSLGAQEQLLADYAKKNNYEVNETVSVPESASGTKERKVFNTLINKLSTDQSITTLVVEKVDRLSRNFKDAVKLDDWLKADSDRQIHFVKQNLVIHKNSKSHEILQWDMYLVLAKQYINNLKEEVRKGQDEKARQGWWPGSIKVGYKPLGESKTWVIHEPDALYIREIFRLSLGRVSLKEIAQKVQDWPHYRKISKHTIDTITKDPFYMGEFNWCGKRYQGKHEPIISKETFIKANETTSRGVGRYRKHHFLFGNGLATCSDCGSSIVGELQKGRVYYHCANRTFHKKITYTEESVLNENVVKILSAIEIRNERLIDWIRRALKEARAGQIVYRDTTLENLQKQLETLNKRRDRLYDEHADGLILEELYQRKLSEYNQLIQGVEKELLSVEQSDTNAIELASNIFELAMKAKDLYLNKLTDEERRKLLIFINSNFSLKNGKLELKVKKPFEVILRLNQAKKIIGAGDGALFDQFLYSVKFSGIPTLALVDSKAWIGLG